MPRTDRKGFHRWCQAPAQLDRQRVIAWWQGHKYRALEEMRTCALEGSMRAHPQTHFLLFGMQWSQVGLAIAQDVEPWAVHAARTLHGSTHSLLAVARGYRDCVCPSRCRFLMVWERSHCDTAVVTRIADEQDVEPWAVHPTQSLPFFIEESSEPDRNLYGRSCCVLALCSPRVLVWTFPSHSLSFFKGLERSCCKRLLGLE